MFAEKIENFLNKYGDSIFDEHKEELLKIKLKLENIQNCTYIFSRYGVHYDNCVWSSNEATEGPDSCHCIFTKIYKERAEKLMNKYIALCLKCKMSTKFDEEDSQQHINYYHEILKYLLVNEPFPNSDKHDQI